jgi:hypothetical protein
LNSINDTVNDHNNIEILIKIDDDDTDTIEFIDSYRSNLRYDIKTVVSNRGNGYADLHLSYDSLCKISSGRFLFLWNDDAKMLTQHWDDELVKHDDNNLYYLQCRAKDYKGLHDGWFPIIHRSYWETLGRYSASAHNDTYINVVTEPFMKDIFRETNIIIEHGALDLISIKDQTSVEAISHWPNTKGIWRDPNFQEVIDKDIEKLRIFLENKQCQ